MSRIALIINPTLHRCSKHVDLKILLIRDHYRKGELALQHVETNLKKVDVLTKAKPMMSPHAVARIIPL